MSDDNAQTQIRSYFDRWSRLEEEKAAISDDLRELFAEMKSNGYDTKVARKVFRDRGADANERAEFEAIYDLYWSALDGPRAGRADVRVEPQGFAADLVATESPRKAAEAVSDRTAIVVAPETGVAEAGGSAQAEVIPALTGQFPGANVSGPERAGVTAGETAPHSEMDGGAIAAVKGQARPASVVDAEPSPSSNLREPKPLRPFCQNRNQCSSGNRDHCWSCKKIMAANEVAA